MLRPSRCALVLLVAVAGCAHPVGPARTYGKYEGKATTTAEAALSNVETVRLVARTAAAGNAFGPYVGTVVSDAEESLDGLSGTFGSIQPPDGRADRLRDQLDQLLGDALDHVTDVRVAARRGRLATLDDTAAALAGDAEHLQAFVEQHS
ncbi:MAG: hypothetical protein JWO68_1853 [Actinomycetia bacterium]|nr:hypothetical protein [Actinomycetes bacterium]